LATTTPINELFVVVAAGEQAGDLTHHLVQGGFYFTLVDSSGGFLQNSTQCLLIGINDARHEALFKLIRDCCHTRRTYIPARVENPIMQGQPLMIEAEIGGATIFVLEVERFEQY
jgi:uncharacterized protein YaaQ